MISFFRKITWLSRRREKEDELAEELRFHLEEETDERLEQGVPEGDAEWAAKRELGNAALLQEETRAAWTWTWIEQLFQDLRYALRTMARNPLFTVMAAMSLALGIGANTAIYTFMDALLMRSLPVVDPQNLAVLNWRNKIEQGTVFHGGSGNWYNDPKSGITARIFPYPAYKLFQKQDAVFSSLFAYYPTRNLNLVIHNQAEIGSGQYVSGDYFRGLGIAPAAGRLLIPDDDRAGASPVIMLGYAFAQARFGEVESAVGRSILVDNLPFTVAGIAPPGFLGVDPAVRAQFFIPLHTNVMLRPDWGPGGIQNVYQDANFYWIETMGRLQPGVTMAQAQAALAPMFDRWVSTTATTELERNHLPGLNLTSGQNGLDTLRRAYSKPFYLLFAMVSLILAIACANVANLLLARASARQREMAVRLSMGAGRWRVIRQLLTESVLLAALGGTAGVLLAMEGLRFLTRLLAGGTNPFPLHPELNWHVLTAAAALSISTGLLFGLAPALRATRVDVMPVLKGDQGIERRRRPRWLRFTLSHVLVVSQIAISMLLLAGAGLFVRTLSNLQSVELGFRQDHVLLFRLNASQAGHRDPEIISFYRNLQQQFQTIPMVRGATMSNSPLVGEGTWGSPVVPVGKQALQRTPDGHESGSPTIRTHILTAGPEFFTTMGIPLLAGREFDERDRLGSLPVAIVNEAWAKANFLDENPMGQHVLLSLRGHPPQDLEIIGVAKNARYGNIKGEYPAVVYMAFQQNLYFPPEETTFELRTAGDPLELSNTVNQIVHKADARVPVTKVITQSAMIQESMGEEILFARLCTGFAALALVIACVGLYGTMAYIVARRTGEIGIRMALGARREQVVWVVLRQVLVMAAIGLAIGLPVAYAAARLVESSLYGIKPNDPAAMGIAIGTLVAAAIAAGYAPARRASRVDPMTALRHE
jgi:predicted permease